MKNILIVSNEWQTLKEYLEHSMQSVNIDGCVDVYTLSEKIEKTFLHYDVMVFRDNALNDVRNNVCDLSIAGGKLYSILAGNLLDIKKAIFLMNSDEKDKIELIKNITISDKITASITIKEAHAFKKKQVRDLIVESSNIFKNVDEKYRYVVKVPKGTETDSKIIVPSKNMKPVKVLMPTANTSIDSTKVEINKLYEGEKLNTTPINYKTGEAIDEVIDIEFDDSAVQNAVIEDYKREAVITLITGESKTGSSTTAMILASTSAQTKKTLLIDMNWSNLGLSYLVEQTLIDSEINNMSLDEFIYGEKLSALKEMMYNKAQLHVISLRLPIKDILTRYDYSYLMTAVIEYAKELYDNIVIDAPIVDIVDYQHILPLINKVIITTPPFTNHIISTLTSVKKSDLKYIDLYKDVDENDQKLRNIILMRTGLFRVINNNIKPLDRKTIGIYCKEFIGNPLKTTAIYVFNGESYIDEQLYNQIYSEEESRCRVI